MTTRLRVCARDFQLVETRRQQSGSVHSSGPVTTENKRPSAGGGLYADSVPRMPTVEQLTAGLARVSRRATAQTDTRVAMQEHLAADAYPARHPAPMLAQPAGGIVCA